MAHKRGWRVLKDHCSRNWYYIRSKRSPLPSLDIKDPVEFKSCEEALAFAVDLYNQYKTHYWHEWCEPAVIFESPEGVREKHWFVPENERAQIAARRSEHEDDEEEIYGIDSEGPIYD